MPYLDVGDPAPDLTLATHDGGQVRLADYHGKSPVVLFFYPKDGSPICTRQACAIRDAYEDFVESGAVVIGISGDSEEQHQGFARQHRLPFLLATDVDGNVRSAFGVPATFGLLPGRVTYVIDKAGIVRLVFNAQFSAGRHVKEALQVIHDINAPGDT